MTHIACCFREMWREVNGVLVGFGQTICKARPLCEQCCINDTCPVAPSVLKKKQKAKPAAKKKVVQTKSEAAPQKKIRFELPLSEESSSEESS